MRLHETAHGHCYLAWQSLLVFGHNRKGENSWRPAVSLLKERSRLYVLPATTQQDDALYPIDLTRCQSKDGGSRFRYSYLSPHPELVVANKLKEVGTLPADICQNIVTWLGNRHLRAAQ